MGALNAQRKRALSRTRIQEKMITKHRAPHSSAYNRESRDRSAPFIAWSLNIRRDLTNAELAHYVQWTINRVTPRTNELRKMGVL
jgi:hypothetical protein